MISRTSSDFSTFLLDFFRPFFNFVIERFIDKVGLIIRRRENFIFLVLGNEYGKVRVSMNRKTSTRTKRRVSDSKRSKIRRASWMLFEISSICFRLNEEIKETNGWMNSISILTHRAEMNDYSQEFCEKDRC